MKKRQGGIYGVLLIDDTDIALGSMHKLQPRRMIPGQKIHASVLYASAYKPKAVLGEGIDLAAIQSEFDDGTLDNQIWETALFDDTAAQELLASLSSQRVVAPIHLERLLFMLRSSEPLYPSDPLDGHISCAFR